MNLSQAAIVRTLALMPGAVVSKTQFAGYATQGFGAYDLALGIFRKHLMDAAEASDQADTPWLAHFEAT